MSLWSDARTCAVAERGEQCENCGSRVKIEAHHMFFPARRGKKKMPEVDVAENLMLVCKACHPMMKGYDKRCWYWDVQVRRYGEERMRAWYDGVPLMHKERLW